MKRISAKTKNAPVKKKKRSVKPPLNVNVECDKDSAAPENKIDGDGSDIENIKLFLFSDVDLPSEEDYNYVLEKSEINDLTAKYSLHSSTIVQTKLMRTLTRKQSPETGDKPSWLNSTDDLTTLDVDDMTKRFSIPEMLAQNWLRLLKSSKTKSLDSTVYFKLAEVIQNHGSLYYSDSNYQQQSSEIQLAYCVHILKHLLVRHAVMQRNEKKLKLTEENSTPIGNFKDRGLVQPKVLILVPFRSKAFEIVNTLTNLLQKEGKIEVAFKKRFKEEFGPSSDDTDDKMAKKPDDYKLLFSGNTDEHFRFGISLTNGAVKLYSQFYKSDVIVASPLGLRTIIGEVGEAHYEFDFLSALEIVVLDHTDMFLMQNWEHILHIMKHMHLQPKESHDVDFSRVFDWCLEGQAKHNCQNIVLTNVNLPSISTLLTKYCYNRHGLATFNDAKTEGTASGIIKQLPLGFHRLNGNQLNFSETPDVRFKFFRDNILKSELQPGTLVFIPQYYDFVRVKNDMRRDLKSATGPAFGYISEYSDLKTVGKARRNFLIQKFPILLYSERYHFYHRPNIKGIKHIVFYELPTYPHFFSEMCNMMSGSDMNMSVSVIYSKFDVKKLEYVVGTARSKNLLQSNKSFFMLVTGKN